MGPAPVLPPAGTWYAVATCDGTRAKHLLFCFVLSPSIKWCPDPPSFSECSEMPKCQLPRGAYRDSTGQPARAEVCTCHLCVHLSQPPSPHLLPAGGALPDPFDDGLRPSLVWAVPAKENCFPPVPGVGVGTWLPCLP